MYNKVPRAQRYEHVLKQCDLRMLVTIGNENRGPVKVLWVKDLRLDRLLVTLAKRTGDNSKCKQHYSHKTLSVLGLSQNRPDGDISKIGLIRTLEPVPFSGDLSPLSKAL